MEDENEVWKDVRGYEGLYQVSNFGRVKNRNRLLKLQTKRDGYVGVALFKDGHRKDKLVHRLVAKAFIENAKGKLEVNHKDGVRTNNCVSNLEWCTRSENMRHKIYCSGRFPENLHGPLRAVRCSETGEVFRSLNEAARKYDGSSGALCQALNTEKYRRRKFKSLHWEYIN